jgi:DNA-binding NarL/FixJ family response regulator
MFERLPVPDRQRLRRTRPEDSSAAAFVLLDATGAVVFASADALKLLGYCEDGRSQPQLHETLTSFARDLLAVAASPNPMHAWSAVLTSGPHHGRYRCRLMPVAARSHKQCALLIERIDDGSSPLAARCDDRHLTRREQEVVALLAAGLTTKEISTHMGVSVNTVKAFVRLVMLKLGVTTRAGILGRLLER